MSSVSLAPPTRRSMLFNANLRAAYQAGLYDGMYRIGDLASQGDFGLGALHRNDGELVALDGRFYRTAADGTTTLLVDDATTPYATVVFFSPERTLDIPNPANKATLERQLDEWLPARNRIFAIKMRGTFRVVIAGASEAQSRPYRLLADVFPSYTLLRHTDVTGTLVGFRCPDYLSGIDYVGYHFHFLSDDRTRGGHVTHYEVANVRVECQELRGYVVALPPKGGKENGDGVEFFETDIARFR